MRTPGTRFGVTKAEHDEVPPGSSHGSQTLNVVSPLVRIERVEQTAIKHRLKHSVQAGESECVGKHEINFEAAGPRLLACDRQSRLGDINSQNLQPRRGNLEGVIAGTTPCIENWADESTLICQAHDRWLRSAGVPRRWSIPVGLIPGLASQPLMTGGPASAVCIDRSSPCLLGHLAPPHTGLGTPHCRMQRRHNFVSAYRTRVVGCAIGASGKYCPHLLSVMRTRLRRRGGVSAVSGASPAACPGRTAGNGPSG